MSRLPTSRARPHRVSLLASCVWPVAQDLPALKVDGNLAKQYVAQLSTDAMQGRASGTDGYRQAAEWAAAQFQQWGLQPGW